MKKIICLLAILLLFTGCSNIGTNQNGEDDKSYSILSPSGAPALVFYNNLENFDVADAGAIKTQVLGDDGPDFCVLPTNVAISLLKKGINYKLAMTITYGNFYICATGKDDNGSMDVDDNIVLFSEGSLPDLLFHYLYEDKYDGCISYVNDASDALREVVSENSDADYVLLAEPSLSVALSKNTNAYEYVNLQRVYNEISSTKVFQASLLVSDNLDHDEAVLFLNNLRDDIDKLLEDPNVLKEKIEEANLSSELAQAIFGNVDVDIVAIANRNRVGIGYNDPINDKAAIDKFISLFDMGETSEEIYFK